MVTRRIFGALGSLRWTFERMNELDVCIGTGGDLHGYTTVLAKPGYGEFGCIQPGSGQPTGFDELKVVEAWQVLASVVTGTQIAPSVVDALAASRVVEAAEVSAAGGRWHTVAA